MVLGVKTAEIFEKKIQKKTFEKTRKRPLESVKIKILKIGLRSDLSWPKVGLEPIFHEPGTFGGFGKCEQTNRHTRFMFYKYRLLVDIYEDSFGYGDFSFIMRFDHPSFSQKD